GKTRAIPQVNKKNSGGLVCESVSMLAEEVEEVSALEGLGIVKHRFAMVKGWLENHEDGFLIAQAGGFTNTLRLKHRQLVNMPSGRVPYGMRLRGLLEAREGCILTGADLSSLENRWKFHHQYPLDPDYVEAQMSDDFDPHLALAEMAGLLTADDVNFYKLFESGYTIPDECYTDELKRRIKKAEE
ncbi:DNA polymerase family A protein, partial [Citrobacter braakii]